MVRVSVATSDREVLGLGAGYRGGSVVSGVRWFIVVAAALVGTLASVAASEAQVVYQYVARLHGSEVVPPTPSAGTGFVEGAFASSYACGTVPDDPFIVLVGYRNLMGAPTGCRIHRGAHGVNGPALYTLLDGLFPSASQVVISFDEGDCPDLEAGNLYVVETTAFPDGEVRGQLIPQPPHPVEPTTWGRIKSSYG